MSCCLAFLFFGFFLLGCLASALLMGGLILKPVKRTHRWGPVKPPSVAGGPCQAFGFACLFLFSHVFTGHRALGRLGRHCLARQFSRPKRYASCRGAYSLHGHLYSCFSRVAHMCHDMTGPAIMAGRLGARTFCLPLAGIACHGLIA